jgi:hypothetical protein
MNAVENNMGSIADNRSLVFAANFPSVPIVQGGQYIILPGLNDYYEGGRISNWDSGGHGNVGFCEQLYLYNRPVPALS